MTLTSDVVARVAHTRESFDLDAACHRATAKAARQVADGHPQKALSGLLRATRALAAVHQTTLTPPQAWAAYDACLRRHCEAWAARRVGRGRDE